MSFREISCGFGGSKSNVMRFFNEENIEGSIVEHNIAKDIYLMKTGIQCRSDVRLESSTNVDGILLSYNLLGYSEHVSKINDCSICLSTNESNILLAKNERSISSAPKGPIKKLNIIIKKDFIQKNIPDEHINELVLLSLEKDEHYTLLMKKNIRANLGLLLHDIYQLPADEPMNDLYLQSKVLEIIYHEFHSLSHQKKSYEPNMKLDDHDMQAIRKAKDILLENIQNPPGIIELSRMVGINDFKLKKGFKIVFDTTPYKLLMDHRMELAKKLLQKSEMNIHEISRHIGYTHAHNFSAVFFKKYGIKPKDIMKTREYYY